MSKPRTVCDDIDAVTGVPGRVRRAVLELVLAAVKTDALPPLANRLLIVSLDAGGQRRFTVAIASGIALGEEVEALAVSARKTLSGVQHCHHCGCTDDHACPGGCSWITPRVCSNPACVAKREAALGRRSSSPSSRKGDRRA